MTRTLKGAAIAAAVIAMLAVTGCASTTQKAVQPATGLKAGASGNTTSVPGLSGQQLPDGGGVKIPDGFPADVPIYNPSTVTTALSLETDKGKTFTVALATADAPATVSAWYQTALKDKGWTVKSTVSADGGGAIITSEKAGQSLEVVVVAAGSGTDTKTTMGISYSPK